MATLEELVVNLVAETKDLRADLSKATKATQSATDKIGEAVDTMSSEGSQNLNMFQQAMGTMAGFVGGQIVIGAFNMAKDAALSFFNTLITDGIAAAQVQEDAINQLNTQLALNGNFSKEASQDMQQFAADLQKVSTVGDETTIQMLALAATFGKSNEETKKLVTAATELSAATGLTLEGSIKNLGKTYAGLTGELGESLPIIRTLTVEQLKAGGALDLIINRFGGSAAAKIQTFSGLQAQLSNSFGDLTETIGEVVTKNQVLLSVMAELNKIMNQTNESVNENQNAMQILVGEGIQMLINTIGVSLTILDQFIRALEFMAGVVNTLLLPLNLLIAAFKALTGGISEGQKHMQKSLEIISEQFNSFSDESQTSITPMIETFADLSVAAEKGMATVRSGVESVVEPMNQAQIAVKELSEAEIARNEQLKQFAQTLLDNATLTQNIYATELENLAIQLEEKAILEDEYFQGRLEALEAKHAAESQILADARARDQITEEQYNTAKTQLEKQQLTESRKLALEKQKFDEKMDAEKLKGYQQLQNGIMQFTNSGNKKVANAAKALATAQATMQAYNAITNALANVPFPANIAAAAGIGAQAFAQISRINGISLNQGGTVPGSGPNRDTVPAMLTSGEEVVNRDTANMLRDFLNGQREGGNVRIELSMRDELVEFIEARILERQNIGVSLLKGAV